jgi:chromosome partitioning related protein ParA
MQLENPQKTTTISVVSTKGGVGKTTQAANIAGILASLGYRVLAIDADMQPSLSHYFSIEVPAPTGLAEVMSRGGIIHPGDICKTNIPGLDLLRSNLSDTTQAWLKNREDRLVLLKRAVNAVAVQNSYDFVIIDTQGAKGELQRTAAMAADVLISPFVPDMMNFAEFFPGTLGMLAELNSMGDFAPSLKAGTLHVVVNSMDRTNNSKAFLHVLTEKLAEVDPAKVTVTQTIIPRADAYRSARTVHLPVHLFDKKRDESSAYQTMHSLVHELFPWLAGRFSDDLVSGQQATGQAQA